MDSTRRQHYCFAHHVLRDYALTDPARFLRAAEQGTLDDELASLWRFARTHAQEEHDRATPALDADGLSGRLVEPGLVLVTLPTPQASHEAWFALIAAPDGRDGRYLTLEESRVGGLPRSAWLCEWSVSGEGVSHAMRHEIPARETSFLAAARSHLQRPAASRPAGFSPS